VLNEVDDMDIYEKLDMMQMENDKNIENVQDNLSAVIKDVLKTKVLEEGNLVIKKLKKDFKGLKSSVD
jgi:hypothetical protein